MSIDRAELLTGGPGITYDPDTGTISIDVSSDSGNAAHFGSDNGLFVFSGGGGALALCSRYFQTDSEGKVCLKPGMQGLIGVQTYDIPGNTFTFGKGDYPWLARVRVLVQAGGGGAAGAAAAAGESIWRAGGAGGGYSEMTMDVAGLPAVVPITVGAGGTAGAASNGNGGNGGNSSFGTIATAVGGPGGQAQMPTGSTISSASGTAGPTTGVGMIAMGGGAGEGAVRIGATAGLGGAGGNSHLGFGGASRATTGVGNAPSGYGGGAGGSVSANGASQAGRAGGPGIVIVELYG
ncbi:glycine-rich domain-containing protein [Streptomyces cinereoruber]|uniref:glycine-rich domain-containing protein n=1 Tax=Streptomyces cinereoruber TaxID=67260 RepID=UPI003C2D61E6